MFRCRQSVLLVWCSGLHLSGYTITNITNSERLDYLPRRVLYSTPLVECSHLANMREHL